MCGLAGWAGPVHLDETTLARMCATLRHRGPNSEGAFTDPGRVALGFRRLSIIDLDTGDQPLYNEDRSIVVTFNGEIYNAPELAERLLTKGHRFSSGSDGEVISHLYEEHGRDFLASLQGMFSIALWDTRNHTLLLARDRMGVKPLYWARAADSLVYASEPQTILASGVVPARPDLHALGQYLTLQYVPAPLTGFSGIRKLAPGEALAFHEGDIKSWTWWRLPAPACAPVVDDPEMLDRLDDLMRQATSSRLRADVALGAFLSGGIDSSLVVAYMAAELTRVRTFSADFRVAAFSEGVHARRVAGIYGTEHQEFTIESDIVPKLAAVVQRLGEPFADASAIPTYLLAALTSQHVTVALSGDGGDEAFGGYARYRAIDVADRLGVIGRPAARCGLMVARGGAGRRTRQLHRGLRALARSPQERYALMMSHFEPQAVAEMTLPGAKAMSAGSQHAWTHVLALPAGRGLNRYMALDVTTYLPGDLLLKVDRMSMAHSLEIRSPFLDYRVQEFAAGLPGHVKVRRGQLKRPLKELAARRGLPADLVHRRKQGFGIPLGPWFRDELRSWLVEVLTDPQTRARRYFDQSFVERMMHDHISGRCDHTARLWNLLMLELWHRSALDAAT